jgi:hypothetical protein
MGRVNRKQQKRKHQRAVGRGRVRTESSEGAAEPKQAPQRSARGFRQPPQPSAMRAAKRAAIFAVLFYLAITYTSLGGQMTASIKLFNAVVMFVLFWSIGTVTETFAWRRWQKKHGGQG